MHRDGFRAEHACVVTHALPDDATAEAIRALEAIATRYRVELVPLAENERAATRHGAPLPDSVGPRPPSARPADLPPSIEPEQEDPPRLAPAYDMTLEEFEQATPISPRRLHRQHVGILVALAVAVLLIALIVFDHRTTPCHVQIVAIPGSTGNIERCAPAGQHGGIVFNP